MCKGFGMIKDLPVRFGATSVKWKDNSVDTELDDEKATMKSNLSHLPSEAKSNEVVNEEAVQMSEEFNVFLLYCTAHQSPFERNGTNPATSTNIYKTCLRCRRRRL
ncbi:unnamed protein product [Caenorhabditis brenneri]